jgi:FkbM family methyltransferase
MRDPSLTFLEVFSHVVSHHPAIAPHMIKLLNGKDVLAGIRKNALLDSFTSNLSAQFSQDLFVLTQTSFMRGGFFVEFGATDGVEGSNTVALEKHFGWKGILVEPGRCWHDSLFSNRGNGESVIDTRCVSEKSGEMLEFAETAVATLSTLASHLSDVDHSTQSRNENYSTYLVESISLCDLLVEHKAPNVVDYISIDTEGSEFNILQSFNFDKFFVKLITVEHNNTQRRQLLFDLLTEKGFSRKFEDLSSPDDWYVNQRFLTDF